MSDLDAYKTEKRLAELARLLEAGQMSHEEFDQERKGLLAAARPPDRGQATAVSGTGSALRARPTMAICPHYTPAQRRLGAIPCEPCGGWVDSDGTVMDRATTIARYPFMQGIIARDPGQPDHKRMVTTIAPEALIAALAGRTRKHLLGALRPDEQVGGFIKGRAKQALVVLDDRLVIVKPGFQAGAGFGAKVTTFPYRQIQGASLRTALLSPGIEVMSSAFPRSVESLGDGGKIRKALYEQPNCLPLNSVGADVQAVLGQINARAGR